MSVLAITGIGLVSAAGNDPRTLFSALVEARPRTADGTTPGGAAAPPGARIAGFDVTSHLQRKGIKQLSRTSQLACASAARLAPALAGVEPSAVGVVLGTAWATTESIVRFEREAHVEGPRFVDPVLFTETVANVPAGHVSIVFGWSAVNATVAAGPASGLDALVRAGEFLDEGRAEVVVAGGADEWNAQVLRVLQADGITARSAASRPFAPDASGPVGGEGACLLALESEAHAAARGAAVLGRVRGCVSRFIDGPPESTVVEREGTLRDLLRAARVEPGDVDLIVLSAGGTLDADAYEARMLVELFGARPPAAVVPKAVLGETWGAAGPLGVAIALQAIAEGRVPPAPPGILANARAAGLYVPDAAEARAVGCALVLDGGGSSRHAALVVTA